MYYRRFFCGLLMAAIIATSPLLLKAALALTSSSYAGYYLFETSEEFLIYTIPVGALFALINLVCFIFIRKLVLLNPELVEMATMAWKTLEEKRADKIFEGAASIGRYEYSNGGYELGLLDDLFYWAAGVGIELEEVMGTIVSLTIKGAPLETAISLTLNLVRDLAYPGDLFREATGEGTCEGISKFIQNNGGFRKTLIFLSSKIPFDKDIKRVVSSGGYVHAIAYLRCCK